MFSFWFLETAKNLLMILGGLFTILVITGKYPTIETVPISETITKKGYKFEKHVVESEPAIKFTEDEANMALMNIRNSLQVFQRIVKSGEMHPDLWSQIHHIDAIAHNQKRERKEA